MLRRSKHDRNRSDTENGKNNGESAQLSSERTERGNETDGRKSEKTTEEG